MVPWRSELMWLAVVWLVSLLISLGIKFAAPLYPLPPSFGVIALLVLLPAALMAIVLLTLNQSDSQNPAP
ncbi:hypothetical protein NK55_11925 [Thermosynechococcus sp. NK55a]|uniref:hypothetical protein n=1 Tax=unclassified Thermosynechococcus TaxID=2622553 RepID=UPI0003D8A3C8|nr:MULTISPECIES: hypothetical protein [unclassified Thermosynechococcus]AHB89614.1 hypothetical protein NK55_11925 [Thermosynechococcus sp. NK55a]RMH63472.1 MAG: hypothetical protein D6676_11350 [Cyanobacteria bacterium J003]HIK22946.1 hypothetical protein [Thermosynechococcus sp. M3746_W2019_013]